MSVSHSWFRISVARLSVLVIFLALAIVPVLTFAMVAISDLVSIGSVRFVNVGRTVVFCFSVDSCCCFAFSAIIGSIFRANCDLFVCLVDAGLNVR